MAVALIKNETLEDQLEIPQEMPWQSLEYSDLTTIALMHAFDAHYNSLDVQQPPNDVLIFNPIRGEEVFAAAHTFPQADILAIGPRNWIRSPHIEKRIDTRPGNFEFQPFQLEKDLSWLLQRGYRADLMLLIKDSPKLREFRQNPLTTIQSLERLLNPNNGTIVINGLLPIEMLEALAKIGFSTRYRSERSGISILLHSVE